MCKRQRHAVRMLWNRIMQGLIKTPLGSKAQQIANQRNTMTKYFPVLHDPGHSNESFPMRERLLPALPTMQVCES